ncbi:MAG: S-layer homology domain-containing protein [Clostridia bacterium]|nr:S-layer homology domain-containing protein [Clostridia bacterium]
MTNGFAKKIVAFSLAILLMIASKALVSADPGKENFTRRYEYEPGVFSDVRDTDWFYGNVVSVYEYGLMNGKGNSRFDTEGNITIAEACTIAARLNAIYTSGSDTFEKTEPWYQVYVDYCTRHGILAVEPDDLTVPATRKLFAAILAHSLPGEELPEINYVGTDSIPDVKMVDEFADEIYMLYRAGITIGADANGTYNPDKYIKRSEVAAIVTRMVDPSLRKEIILGGTFAEVFVSPDADASVADGSESKPYRTLDAAREAVRAIDRSRYQGINVILKSGVYPLTSTVEFTAEDSGTSRCRIRYIGEEGTVLNGGTIVANSDFVPASGDAMQYFPEKVRDELLMLDLSKYGYTAEGLAADMASVSGYADRAANISVNGVKMELARYPDSAKNIEDGWVEITGGEFRDKYGNYTALTDNDPDTEHHPVSILLAVPQEVIDRARTWHAATTDVRTVGRLTYLWAHDNSVIEDIDTSNNLIKVKYVGAYYPKEGGIIYFYNIPEELDSPNEYYIDPETTALYYYPSDDMRTAVLSIPKLDAPVITFSGAEYISFESMRIENGRDHAVKGEGNNIILKDLLISDFVNAIALRGSHNLITLCTIHDITDTAVIVEGGDTSSLTKAETKVYNNLLYRWGVGTATLTYAIQNKGCGITVSHNEMFDAKSLAMNSDGNLHVIEYNKMYDVAKLFNEGGVFGDGGSMAYGTVLRYNLVMHAGAYGFSRNITPMGVQGITVDCDCSGLTIYGNIIYDVTGYGIGIAGGRDHIMHDNLFVATSPYALAIDGREYVGYFKGGNEWPGEGWAEIRAAVNPAWREAFPVLAQVVVDESQARENDANLVISPGGCSFTSNFIFFDKVRIGEWGLKYIYAIDGADMMSTFEDPTAVVYSSKRSGHPPLEECVEKAQEAINLPSSEVSKIGRVMSDWE